MTNIHTIMTADESGKELVEHAERLADALVKNNLTRSQIRGILPRCARLRPCGARKGARPMLCAA